MSKAVLVMDMPESCSNCRFYNPYGYKAWTCILTGNILGVESEEVERHSSCPLKPLPGKMKGIGEYATAWNDFYDAIGGNDD